MERTYDKHGNLLHEAHDDGFEEINKYDSDNNLIRSECRYSNGIVEVENYTYSGKERNKKMENMNL